VYGAYGKNFLKTILRLAAERDNLKIVADQFGAPTSSHSIAEGVVNLLNVWQDNQESQTGIYHFTNTEYTSWHGFSCEIVTEYNRLSKVRGWPKLKANVEDIIAISTAEYPTPAARPQNSKLDNTKLKSVFKLELPSWQQGLQQVIQSLQIAEK